MILEDFVASNDLELRRILLTWGKLAPYRLDRRGQKKLCEAYCLNRYLVHQSERGEIAFPVTVEQDENPDFRLTFDGAIIGIEVTEACCETEQAEWTGRAKEAESVDDVVLYDICTDNGRAIRVKKMVHDAIDRKAKSASKRVDELLVYLNTQDDAFESNEWRTSAIGLLPDSASRFLSIWLLTDVGIIKLDISRGTVSSETTQRS